MINVELDLGRVPGNFATGRDGGAFWSYFPLQSELSYVYTWHDRIKDHGRRH